MEQQEYLKRQLAEAVTKFLKEYMSVTAESIHVDVHVHYLLMSFWSTTCPAEKNYARDGQARQRLERLFKDVFDATKAILEAATEKIIGQPVQQSSLSMDYESGHGVILIKFADEL